ncbi:hypothetical protein GSI_02535 [Ganoderma sinense ZZ0214-1]|uniref:Uncharacterized protein n=1 Tax=Ganoderma sinense ZZ0214-1 TaxID=1077348 RepID=A0A2G8SME7_9APHY|nr:hypothetical protein GSI_02535 [Ganoderma sinense ZZ0214-1]
MEIARPLPSSLSSSSQPPPPLSHQRHRRPAFSGKLLGLFTTKGKPTPGQSRPVISQPQPLQGRIPARPKRAIAEVSNGENEPPVPSPRPRFRIQPSSDSNVASDHAVLRSSSPERKLHTPPRGDRVRPLPLKSALKKSALENASHPPSPDSGVLSSSSIPPETSLKSRRSKVTARVSGGTWMSFTSSSRNHATGASSDARDPRPSSDGTRQKKTVSFALEEVEAEAEPRSSTSKLVPLRASAPDELSHWDEIAQELDSPAPSRPSSVLKRKAEDYPEPRRTRTALPSRPGSPTVMRKAVFKPVASSPPVSYRRPLYSRPVPNHGDTKDLVARRLPQRTTSSKADRAPGLTFMGGIVDTALQECARDKIRSPPHNVKATARSMEGSPGVLRRITADIVPNERHSVVWDANERDTFAWGGTIILRDAKAASYFYPRHCIKDFHLEFCALPEPRSGLSPSSATTADPDAPPTYDWRTSYTGHFLKRHDVRQELDVARGIALEPDFVFVKPDDPDGAHAWMVHFWVPVPLALFARSVHRTFLCRAKIVVGGYDTPETVIPAGCIATGIESLKSEGFIKLAGGARDGRAEES